MHLVTAVHLARSWQESNSVPEHAALREVTAVLRTFIHRLLPEAELYGAGLPAGSDESRAIWQMVVRARRLAAKNVPRDPRLAVEHAVELGDLGGLFLSLAEKAIAPVLVSGGTPAGPR